LTIQVLHGSVVTQLRCGGMFNKRINGNCPQSVPVKKFWKSDIIWQRHKQSRSGTFFWDTIYNSVM